MVILKWRTQKACVSLDVVAKLAFNEDQRENLNHEYAIYLHLAPKAVKNIPTALGLFDDVEKRTLVLYSNTCWCPYR